MAQNLSKDTLNPAYEYPNLGFGIAFNFYNNFLHFCKVRFQPSLMNSLTKFKH